MSSMRTPAAFKSRVCPLLERGPAQSGPLPFSRPVLKGSPSLPPANDKPSFQTHKGVTDYVINSMWGCSGAAGQM
jgi:hypothetical protein